MPSTKTLNQSQTIGATEDADLLWIWDNSSAELDKISLGNLFAANQTFALLNGRSGGQTLIGGTAANDDLILEGTSSATRTTSYVILQPNGGNVGIGTTDPAGRFDAVVDGAGGIFRRFGGSVPLLFRRANGSISSPTQITATSPIGIFSADGLDDTGVYRSIAGMRFVADTAITSTSSPGIIIFSTTPSGSTAAADRLTIRPDGNVGIGTTNPGRTLHVVGTILIDGDESGVAGTIGLTDVNDATLSTGNGTVKLKGTTTRDSAGFIKIYVGTTTAWIPYWTNIS